MVADDSDRPVQRGQPDLRAASHAAGNPDVTAASGLCGGALAGFPAEGYSAGPPRMTKAALHGDRRPDRLFALRHQRIQTCYRYRGKTGERRPGNSAGCELVAACKRIYLGLPGRPPDSARVGTKGGMSMQFGIFSVSDITRDPVSGETPSEAERIDAVVQI